MERIRRMKKMGAIACAFLLTIGMAFPVQAAEEASGTEQSTRLEQVYLNMPEVYFYLSSEDTQNLEQMEAYIGKEKLDGVSIQEFSETGKGITYFVLVDISASVSERGFAGIKEGLCAFSDNLTVSDKMIVKTFGEQVTTVLTGSETREERQQVLESLVNKDQRTLLFEAVDQMTKEAERIPAEEATRRVALVITDGEDIAAGKATRDEALKKLNEAGLPVYGLTAKESRRAAVNSFGEFSRESGGTLTILETGQEAEQLKDLQKMLQSSYEIQFRADTNQAANGKVDISLKLLENNITFQRSQLQNRWVKDLTAPEISQAEEATADQLNVQFTEAVKGGETPGNYHLTFGETVYTPLSVSVTDVGTKAVLTFAEELPAGEGILSVNGITDASMEKNPVADTYTLVIAPKEAAEEETGISIPLLVGAAIAAVLLILAVIFAMKKKKAKQQETVGEDISSVKAGEKKQHVVVEGADQPGYPIVLWLEGQNTPLNMTIREKLLVGRSANCNLHFDDPSMSRQHFLLEMIGDKLYIQNLSQGGFTAVNGVKLPAGRHVLSYDDRITAGQVQMRIRW